MVQRQVALRCGASMSYIAFSTRRASSDSPRCCSHSTWFAISRYLSRSSAGRKTHEKPMKSYEN